LNIDLHQFSPSGGISGVAVLAESHISIHTWPERQYAAVDVFMCGNATPLKAVTVLKEALEPKSVTLVEHRRGMVP
jgi:S-adenosylmethionine decarboxylase